MAVANNKVNQNDNETDHVNRGVLFDVVVGWFITLVGRNKRSADPAIVFPFVCRIGAALDPAYSPLVVA